MFVWLCVLLGRRQQLRVVCGVRMLCYHHVIIWGCILGLHCHRMREDAFF